MDFDENMDAYDTVSLIFPNWTATLYTRDKAVMRKLDTLVADFQQRERAGQMMIERNKANGFSACHYKFGSAVEMEEGKMFEEMWD